MEDLIFNGMLRLVDTKAYFSGIKGLQALGSLPFKDSTK